MNSPDTHQLIGLEIDREQQTGAGNYSDQRYLISLTRDACQDLIQSRSEEEEEDDDEEDDDRCGVERRAGFSEKRLLVAGIDVARASTRYIGGRLLSLSLCMGSRG